ncbi:MAG: nucleotidyltransferase domain-containing protein [Planctomycetes bacterium]|nr:nucleotidyltransferase domain-containing protein [Planctomycetota bacterium]
MRQKILAHLSEIEAGETVKVVYACESGSRAWGFPSSDSDYDVRFIYVRPIEWYLSIFDRHDVIERPIDGLLDITGWDLKKALQLLRKSNPPLLEWLGSPIVYWEKHSTAARMRKLTPMFYSPTACLYHYLHMARGNFRDYLQGEEVWVKKYFYVLRPILAMIWIEQGFGVVPTEFKVLVDRLVIDPKLRMDIDRLIAAKRAGEELDRGQRIATIGNFIERELERLGGKEVHHDRRSLPDVQLDELFRASIMEVWQT